MEEYRDDKHKAIEESPRSQGAPWLAAAAVLLVIATAAALIYGYRQQETVSQLASRNQQAAEAVNGMQDQINTLTSKLNDVSTAQAAAASNSAGLNDEAAKRRAAAQSKRMKQMQVQMDDQGKQLKDTQDSLTQARADLEGNLNSTRDTLNSSIARTHEELVALEQRGERNYWEFDLTKTKSRVFQRSGPISVSLRRTDPKHHNYDVMLLVDDNPLSKRNVDLYEPIWLTADASQQVQIVVNKIDKNHVHGYVSSPKYPRAQMVSTSAPVPAPAPMNPDNSPVATPTPDHSSLPPQ